jgi:hypothetical protein
VHEQQRRRPPPLRRLPCKHFEVDAIGHCSALIAVVPPPPATWETLDQRTVARRERRGNGGPLTPCLCDPIAPRP